jgi:hypothetical protein
MQLVKSNGSAAEACMGDEKPPVERPLWVKVGLWGVPGRAGAWAFAGLSLVLAAASVAYGFEDRRFFWGGLLVFAAVWYYLSIRWVDRHGRWA